MSSFLKSLPRGTVAIFCAFIFWTVSVEASDSADAPPMTEEAAEAAYQEARALRRAGDPKAAYDLILPYAQAGFPQAQHFIGFLYSEGEGVTLDYQESAKWFQKAASQSFAKSTFALGHMHQFGEFFEKDPKKAIEYFEIAARLGHPGAPERLGHLYYYGDESAQDFKKAEFWWKLAADEGDVLAQYGLGLLFKKQGKKPAAIEWLKKAHAGGERSAKFPLWSLGVDLKSDPMTREELECSLISEDLDDCFSLHSPPQVK